MSSGRSLHGRSGSGSRRWPPTASRRRICTLRFPRKRSRSRRKSLRRRSDDGPSDDDSGVAEPRNLEEDRRDSGGRRLHAGEARGIEARAPREVHPEKGGRESPQETRHRPRGGEACPEAREGGQARSPREEALGEGYGGGAGSAPHNSREGTAAHLGRAGDHGRVEGDRPVAPPVRRDGAIEENSRTQAQQETPPGSPPKNLREVRSPRDRRQRIGGDRVRAIDRRTGTQMTMRTFHYAGVAEMNVTLGLPRLIEIVDARRVPSTPIMELYVKSGHTDLERMRKIATEIEMTSLEDIASIETDLVNMRVLAYPDDHRMKSRGVTWQELEEKLKKLGEIQEVRRQVGNAEKKARALVVEAGEPSFKKLQRLVEQVRVMKIKGIDGISRAIIRKRGDGYVIYTEGSNLSKILELPYVDAARTSTNSVQEIYEVLGIEAARNAIVNEAYNTLQEQGLTVDIRHIMLVSDMMTNDGDVKAIGRHGISGRKSSVLARAAFEITAHHLLRAAITGEVDYLDGVAENVIVGQPVTLGTGAVNLIYKPPPGLPKPMAVPKPKPAATAPVPPPPGPEEPLEEVVP